MPRRFLTAEDVRRAGAREIVVDPSTVVTPQAQEQARVGGVTIRVSGGGPWAEPAPDRGPDALEAVHDLPHMPEPIEDTPGSPGAIGVIVTAVGRNRPGVLAEVTAAVAGAGGSIRDVSQKTVEGFFHLLLVVELDGAERFQVLKEALQCLGGQDDYVVRVMHERVFRFMHRV